MEEEIQETEAQIRLKMIEVIRNMEAMKEIGTNVNVELYRQDEALERIDRSLENTHQQMKQAKNHLKSIDGFWGFLKNSFSGWKQKPAKLPKTVIPPIQNIEKPTTIKQTVPKSEQDDMLDELVNQSQQIRQMVSTTNYTLNQQGQKIQSISGKVDRNINNTKVLNRKCQRLLD